MKEVERQQQQQQQQQKKKKKKRQKLEVDENVGIAFAHCIALPTAVEVMSLISTAGEEAQLYKCWWLGKVKGGYKGSDYGDDEDGHPYEHFAPWAVAVVRAVDPERKARVGYILETMVSLSGTSLQGRCSKASHAKPASMQGTQAPTCCCNSCVQHTHVQHWQKQRMRIQASHIGKHVCTDAQLQAHHNLHVHKHACFHTCALW
jgi:hypothetical protein